MVNWCHMLSIDSWSFALEGSQRAATKDEHPKYEGYF